jgi:hypothetical protein
MREDAADQYLSYKLIESNQDWKAKWFHICNHHPELMVEHRADNARGYPTTRANEEDQGP